ncbi:MAG TPA: GDSL-type esterase/lipase family protein [Chthoniobacteraceae bacterium]|nr:GDSL-type esterase/lipase family protein [Chthoniobacteraceae bacterium]
MRSAPILFALALALLPPLRAQQTANPTAPNPADIYEARTFTGADGAALGYRLLPPQNYDAKTKYPLVLFLHGAGERGTDNAAQLKHGAPLFAKPEVRGQYPCFVVAPQCPPEKKWVDIDWNSDTPKQPEINATMSLVLGALDAVQKEFSVDPDRLYVTGLSMGGYGTWDFITRFPEKWAAAAPVCGGGDKELVIRAKSVPIWAFHGLEDKTVKPERSRELIDAIVAAGGKPLLSEYPYLAHDSWTTAYGEPELLPWLFAQKRGQPAVPFATIVRPFAQPPSNQFPGAGPVQSGLWFRALWRDRREQWSKDRAQDQGAVVFFGDSITQGWASLAKDFPNFKVANRGIGGDTTRGLRYRLSDDVAAVHPRAVAILIGTNDLDQGAEPELVAENLKVIVHELHAVNSAMPIIISKVMPRGAKPGKFPEKIQRLNALYEDAFRADKLVSFCETWSLFDDGAGQCKREEFPDMLHPNAAGYAKWTEAMRAIFEKLKL